MLDSLLGGNGLTLIFISIVFTIIIGFALVMWIRAMGRKTNKSYEEQLNELLKDDIFDDNELKPKPLERWTNLWRDLFAQMGWERYLDVETSTAGRDVALGMLIVAVAASAITQNLFIGPFLALVLGAGLYLVSKNVSSKKSDAISDQLPGFLFALKANIQANETPERAIIKVIDSMPSPLYDDLLIVRNHILSNSTFKEALLDLKTQTANRDLKFLASCMIQATSSGANLEPQIATIQKVLDSRRAVSQEISKAARSASPAIWVSSIAIPGAFVAIFFSSPAAADFWFVNPISWILLGVIIGLWGLGVFLSRRMVNSIKNI